MSEKKQEAPKRIVKIDESMSGVKNLSPKNLEIGKSLSGVGNLSPQNLQSSQSNSSQNSGGTPSEKGPSSKEGKK